MPQENIFEDRPYNYDTLVVEILSTYQHDRDPDKLYAQYRASSGRIIATQHHLLKLICFEWFCQWLLSHSVIFRVIYCKSSQWGRLNYQAFEEIRYHGTNALANALLG